MNPDWYLCLLSIKSYQTSKGHFSSWLLEFEYTFAKYDGDLPT